MSAEAAGRPAGVRTLGEELARVAPGRSWRQLLDWPPDAFAAGGALLADSGAYRCVVCPPGEHPWPPPHLLGAGERWEAAVRRCADEWSAWVGEGRSAPRLRRLCATLDDAHDLPLGDLDGEAGWAVLTALLGLYVAADETAAGMGFRRETTLQRRAALLLAETGSLSTLDRDRVRVLPKLRAPETGITLRSLSHHLALDRSEVETRWSFSGRPEAVEPDRLTLLLVPFPAAVRASDFRPVTSPLVHLHEHGYGFYEYVPRDRFDADGLMRLVDSASRHVGPVDIVVLPEAALDQPTAADVQRRLLSAGIPFLIAGVREDPPSAGRFGGSYAHFAGPGGEAPRQYKHHRWCVDQAQIQQYHLGAALDPGRRWWEAIAVHRRSLTFVTLSEQLTICPLVCEDLARPDPVADVIRAVAPTLLVALLFDGPQLAERWPARYASVLADDPGCSVLTLTASGMAERCSPAGCTPSRVIALWKDPRRGLLEIPLVEGAQAVAVTAHLRDVRGMTADGRRRASATTELVLSGLEQID